MSLPSNFKTWDRQKLAMDVIEPTQITWVSTKVFISKKTEHSDASLTIESFFAVAIWDSYLRPPSIDYFISLGFSTICSTMDANVSYRQVEVAKNDPDKMASVSHHILSWFTSMISWSRQRTSERTSSRWIIYSAWFNCSSTCVSHWYRYTYKAYCWVPRPSATCPDFFKRRLCNMGEEKFWFFTTRIDFLGYFSEPGHQEASSHSIKTISNVNLPFITTKLRPFLFVHGAFQWFLPNVARVSTSLSRKRQKELRSVFSEVFNEKFHAFHTIQERISSSLGLADYNCKAFIWWTLLLTMDKLNAYFWRSSLVHSRCKLLIGRDF